MSTPEIMAKPRTECGPEVRSFKMHDKLLVDVITRQAGSIEKAVAEAVMNSIDAKATKIELTVTQTAIRIVDNGKGFRSKDEITSWFEVFGAPHSEEEAKTYGTFRMGRGQGFAFGRNTWRSGTFEMKVDIRGQGLNYDLVTDLAKVDGCDVTIDLYTPLECYQTRWVEDEVKKMVRYVDVPVLVNGVQVSVDPASRKWDYETDDAWVEVTDSRTMRVYNLGVYIKDHGTGEFGAGGTVVSKKAFKMNFARNDIINDCEIWKRVKNHVHKQVDGGAKTKKLTEAMRIRLVSRFRDGDLTNLEASEAPIFKDAVGRWWSIAKLAKAGHRFSNKMTLGDCSQDRRADKLMQLGAALVLDANWAKFQFECETVESLMKLMKKVHDVDRDAWDRWSWTAYEFKTVVGDISNTYDLVDRKEWTGVEAAVLTAAESGTEELLRGFSDRRREQPERRSLTMGQSGVAEGWTDGETYIAIDREWLKKVGTDLSGWIRIGQLLCHEYCHDEASGSGHVHDHDFYEMHHNVLSKSLHMFVRRAMQTYEASLAARGKRATKKQLLEKSRIERIEKKRASLEAVESSFDDL